MGLLDGLLGSLMGGSTQTGQSPLLQMALQVIQQNGGLPGIIGKFQQAGYGQQAGSWVGTGQNLPISADQLQQVLGSGSIAQIAQQLGLSHGEAGSSLAQALPQIIDKLTPTGQISADHSDMLAQAMAALSKRTA
ncbi:MAG TPA: YidB family protein [Casimicrobiaceae bacterium]|nr:YidB family protein [Casimicrobiaceae bacterium]